MSEQTSVLITKECIEDVDLVALCEHYGTTTCEHTPHEDGVVLTFFNSDVARGFFTGFHMAHRGQRVYYERDEEPGRSIMKFGAEGKGWKNPPLLLEVV